MNCTNVYQDIFVFMFLLLIQRQKHVKRFAVMFLSMTM